VIVAFIDANRDRWPARTDLHGQSQQADIQIAPGT
jgi:hypothetical protein